MQAGQWAVGRTLKRLSNSDSLCLINVCIHDLCALC